MINQRKMKVFLVIKITTKRTTNVKEMRLHHLEIKIARFSFKAHNKVLKSILKIMDSSEEMNEVSR